ncbi:MAG: leucine--tRNA ligase, partial [Planctomycetota bacterium]
MTAPKYDFASIEARWRRRWDEEGLFRADLNAAGRRFFCLVMYPYPSGDLHVGHGKNYFIGDVVARYRKMRGDEVLHPMGWDAFGLPAENAAIKEGVDPERFTYDNIAKMRRQMREWSISYDWGREIATCHPGYYKWNQWLFLQMVKRGLAYRKAAPVNWCPSCNTVLANEQVVDGRCERCGTVVEQRQIEQWFVRITAYAQRLLDGLDALDGWPAAVKEQQRHWIGRSDGAEIDFPMQGGGGPVRVFTTRPDTLWGATFMVLAPEHPFVSGIADPEVAAYVRAATAKSRIERAAEGSGKTGVFTGRSAVNPATGKPIPIWVADFVLPDYGTGAIMSVPAHDQRDFEFARAFGLPVAVVIEPPGAPLDPATMTRAVPGEGVCVRSGPLDGLPPDRAREAAIGWLEREGKGKRAVSWRIRDWLVSRQRYWGTPIPIIHCKLCGAVPVPEKDLPVVLPKGVDFRPTGKSPLASVEEFVRAECPHCGGRAQRETDTLDTFTDSSWYFFRYLSPRDDARIFDPEAAGRWFPIDQYIGGIEHARGHLLYCRFLTMFLKDLGWSPVDEPVKRLFTQGMICKRAYRCETHKWLHESEVEAAESDAPRCRHCGQPVSARVYKMSKTRRNVTSPGRHIAEVGVDASRLYTLFIGPPEIDAEWNDRAVWGPFKFLARLWESAHEHAGAVRRFRSGGAAGDRALRRRTHQTIRAVTEDLEGFHFNTAIARLMELSNAIRDAGDDPATGEALWTTALLVAPFAPHIAEELHALFGGKGSIFRAGWPEADAAAAAEEEIELPVQINGKLRARIRVPAGAGEDAIKRAARADG